MNLLDKFSTVKIDNNDNLSSIDRSYCEETQRLYLYSRNAIFQRYNLIKKQEEEQDEIIESIIKKFGESRYSISFIKNDYDNEFEKILAVNDNFIIRIVDYFSNKYKVSLGSTEEYYKTLVPQKPNKSYRGSYFSHVNLSEEEIEKAKQENDAYEAKLEEYKNTILNFTLDYKDIVNIIFSKLNGLSFTDCAVKELKDKCREAAIDYHGNPKYTIKKNNLSFSYGCSFDNWTYNFNGKTEWKLLNSMKIIIEGLRHFAFDVLGGLTDYPFEKLLDYEYYQDIYYFQKTDKILQVKSFKNGKFEIKFDSEETLRDFVNGYLV